MGLCFVFIRFSQFLCILSPSIVLTLPSLGRVHVVCTRDKLTQILEIKQIMKIGVILILEERFPVKNNLVHKFPLKAKWLGVGTADFSWPCSWSTAL